MLDPKLANPREDSYHCQIYFPINLKLYEYIVLECSHDDGISSLKVKTSGRQDKHLTSALTKPVQVRRS